MKSRFAALLLAGIMTLSLVACGQQAAENTASTSEPETIVEQPSIPEGVLAIAEQGMFSAGGTVITSDGTFDVSNYYTSREGSTAHVDHANVLYQITWELQESVSALSLLRSVYVRKSRNRERSVRLLLKKYRLQKKCGRLIPSSAHRCHQFTLSFLSLHSVQQDIRLKYFRMTTNRQSTWD